MSSVPFPSRWLFLLQPCCLERNTGVNVAGPCQLGNFLHDNTEDRSHWGNIHFFVFVVSSPRPAEPLIALFCTVATCAVLPACSLFTTFLSRLATIFLPRVATKSPAIPPALPFPGRFLLFPFFLLPSSPSPLEKAA